MITDGPKGLPAPGDEGLERTHSWGRTYWGGALFCLSADVEIRKRTSNAKSFDDVLRAIVASGAYAAHRWDIERFLATAESATGTRVVREVYERLALAPGRVDLDAMWRDLGVSIANGAVSYDDAAPSAAVRRAITGSP
jgi:predicted metalloprotease with PDZ domain